MKFKKHIFICTNQRPEGARKSCGESCGLSLVSAFKKALKERSLDKEIRAQKAGCLDACDYGPSLVVYPEGVYYGNVQESDVEEIITEHLLNDRYVNRLVIDFSEPKSTNEPGGN